MIYFSSVKNLVLSLNIGFQLGILHWLLGLRLCGILLLDHRVHRLLLYVLGNHLSLTGEEQAGNWKAYHGDG